MTNTINNVPRDWFDRAHALLYKVAYERTPTGLEAECLGSFIPDILSAQSPAGVDGLDALLLDIELLRHVLRVARLQLYQVAISRDDEQGIEDAIKSIDAALDDTKP